MIHEILRDIEAGSRFLLTTHEGPDGDAIGSTLGLANFLISLGKEVVIHSIDPVPEIYSFLPLAETVRQDIPPGRFDVCFVLDVGEFRRAGKKIVAAVDIEKFINIDHHATCESFGAINLIDPTAAATGVLIYRILVASGRSISYETALCLYVATMTDTGSFRYSNANREAFVVAGELVSHGINAWYVAEKLYESQPKARLELLALALTHLNVADSGKIASLAVTCDMYTQTGATAELTDGFVNYPRSISGVEVAIFFREMEAGKFKVGFRSKGKVNVAELAARFGGGGHHNAAGCVLSGELVDVRRTMYASLADVV
jgi:phosphoesterase RecJ-like protein